MYRCAQCSVLACRESSPDHLPANCPMRQTDLMQTAFSCYEQPENHRFYVTSSEIEAKGYCEWPRLKETVEFCRDMGFCRIGLAFCCGLRHEARVVDNLLCAHGFEVVSVICKTGGIDKTCVGIAEKLKVSPGSFEPMCNPIAQAKLLNASGTEFNIALGLCVGHDSMFYKYSDALVTTLIAKDRVLAHNPAGAIYCAEGYFKDKLK